MKRVWMILLCALLVLSTAGCFVDAPQPTETTPVTTEPEPTAAKPEVITDEVRAQWDAMQKEHLFEGIIRLTRNGEVVYQSVSGTNDLGQPLTVDSPMFMNSVSKQFCACAILMLRDQGKLSLDDTLDQYFPDFTKAKDVTLRNLLSMRSGLTRYYMDLEENLAKYAHMTREELKETMLEWLYEQPLTFEPDSTFEYNNTNYVLLAYVVEQVSGIAYEDYIRQHIFEPLGMTHSGFSSDVAGHPEWGLTFDNLTPGSETLEMCKGCGDIVSTAGDMEIWMNALPNGKVICEESYREMATSYSNGSISYAGYGYGLMLCPRGGWGHGGNNKASSNYIYFNTDYGYNLYIATPNTPEFALSLNSRVTWDFINILFKAEDAAAAQQGISH